MITIIADQGTKDGLLPDADSIPIDLRKMKDLGFFNGIFEIDLNVRNEGTPSGVSKNYKRIIFKVISLIFLLAFCFLSSKS